MSNHSNHVILIQNRLPRYREDFFCKLFESGKKNNINYELYLNIRRDQSRKDESTLNNSNIKYFSNIEFTLFGRTFGLRKINLDIIKCDLVICEFGLKNILTILLLKILRIKPTAFWGHGEHYGKKYTKIEKMFRDRVSKIFSYYFVYTKNGKIHLETIGFKSKNVFLLNNTINERSLINARENTSATEIREFQNRYNINDAKICVFIGSLDTSKRLEFLIEAIKIVKIQNPEFKLLIFGEGIERHYLEKVQNDSFILLGRSDLKSLGVVANIAKFILMPGLVGLVAVDSFALQLPIITTQWEYHSPEFEYLENGKDCLIVKDDILTYASTISHALNNRQLIEGLKRGCREKAEVYSLENMVDQFHNGVIQTLSEL